VSGAPHPWLAGLLLRKNDDGTLKFTTEQVEDFFGAIFLIRGFAAGELEPSVENAVLALATRAALDPNDTPEARGQKLNTYFEAHPIPPELSVDFTQLLQEEIVQDGTAEEARAFLELIDAAPTKFENRERKAGTHPGGALGFFMAKKDLKK
jgi:hypothetical protein